MEVATVLQRLWWDTSSEHTFKRATDVVLFLTILSLPLAAMAIVSAKRDAAKAMALARQAADEAMAVARQETDRAILLAKADLIEERRISFELDTLRGLATLGVVKGGGGEEDDRVRPPRFAGCSYVSLATMICP